MYARLTSPCIQFARSASLVLQQISTIKPDATDLSSITGSFLRPCVARVISGLRRMQKRLGSKDGLWIFLLRPVNSIVAVAIPYPVRARPRSFALVSKAVFTCRAIGSHKINAYPNFLSRAREKVLLKNLARSFATPGSRPFLWGPATISRCRRR